METLWKKIIPFFLRYAAAFACIAVTKLLLTPFEPHLGIQIIALLFLLAVILSTVIGGLIPGVLASFVAFLVFNYYYIKPYYTFQVHATQDLISLIVFLIVAVVISQLLGQAREGMRLARSREWEATRMYELLSALSGLQDADQIAQALAHHTQETFPFERVEIVRGAPNNPSPTANQAGSEAPTLQMPLWTTRSQEGQMRIWQGHGVLSAQEKRLLEAYLSQGALALERIRLTDGQNKARVLEESDQLKSSLLNSVSHELRSPLAAIKASVSSLRTGTVEWNSAARQDLLATIEEETDHLNLLVGNLLDMSRIESGALIPQKRWNAIDEIIVGVATRMRKHLADHQLDIDLPKNLPLVPTDYVMIEQVFINLISNGVKYAPANTVISISAREENGSLHAQVTNQGPPVPEAHLERIFDKFYRVTAADRVTGTGLGLSICKGIVEAHGGKIWAENQDGLFVFHFTLPLTLNGALPDVAKEAGDG